MESLHIQDFKTFKGLQKFTRFGKLTAVYGANGAGKD